jgi:antitoxin CptB
MDLIMGSFADCYVKQFDAQQLSLYEEILTHNDPDLYNWISGQENVPANYMNPVMEMLLRHRFSG